MRKLILIVISIIVMFSLFNGIMYVYEAKVSQKSNLKGIYIMALEEIINLDEEMHKDKKYFALNTDTLEGLSDIEKQEVLDILQLKYKKEVVDASYIDLLNSGREKRGEETSCVLLYIEKVYNYILRMKIHVGKQYASLGGNGIILDFRYRNGEWIIFKLKHSWVS